MFRLNRNERSHWSGNGVHVESELVFMIGRNMQLRQVCFPPLRNRLRSLRGRRKERRKMPGGIKQLRKRMLSFGMRPGL